MSIAQFLADIAITREILPGEVPVLVSVKHKGGKWSDPKLEMMRKDCAITRMFGLCSDSGVYEPSRDIAVDSVGFSCRGTKFRYTLPVGETTPLETRQQLYARLR